MVEILFMMWKSSLQLCSKNITSGNGKRHMRRKHSQNGVESVKCEHCLKSFTTSSSLRSHIRNIHTASDNREECETCNKTFSLKGNLKHHIAIIHEKRRNFKCDACGKSFYSSTVLNGPISTFKSS